MEQQKLSSNGCKIATVWAEAQNGHVRIWSFSVSDLSAGMVVKDIDEADEPHLALSRYGRPLGWFRYLADAQKAVEADCPGLLNQEVAHD